jgi:hypothetical protein
MLFKEIQTKRMIGTSTESSSWRARMIAARAHPDGESRVKLPPLEYLTS